MTPDRSYFCVWDGWVGSSLARELVREPLVRLPDRRYVLFSGDLREIEHWQDHFGDGQLPPPPAFVWPADRRWCFTSDVDPHWAGIGADTAAVTTLVERRDLDVVRTSWDQIPLAYTG